MNLPWNENENEVGAKILAKLISRKPEYKMKVTGEGKCNEILSQNESEREDETYQRTEWKAGARLRTTAKSRSQAESADAKSKQAFDTESRAVMVCQMRKEK